MNSRYKIAEFIGNFIITKTNSSKEKRENVVYGLWNIITIIILLTILFIIKHTTSILLNINIPIFVTYFSFSVLRVYLGGFHLTNTDVCLITTIILTSICSIIALYIRIDLSMLVVIYVVGYLIIYIIGVIDNKNKRYSSQRKIKYKKYGFVLLTGLLIVNILLYLNNHIVVSNAIVIGMLMEISNLLLGKYTLKN